MKKNGFIATSLLYSFLTIFVILIASVLAAYSYYRNTVDNINKSVMKVLNEKISSRYVYLENLIINGDFEYYETENDNKIYNPTKGWTIGSSTAIFTGEGYGSTKHAMTLEPGTTWTKNPTTGEWKQNTKVGGNYTEISQSIDSEKCYTGDDYYVSFMLFYPFLTKVNTSTGINKNIGSIWYSFSKKSSETGGLKTLYESNKSNYQRISNIVRVEEKNCTFKFHIDGYTGTSKIVLDNVMIINLSEMIRNMKNAEIDKSNGEKLKEKILEVFDYKIIPSNYDPNDEHYNYKCPKKLNCDYSGDGDVDMFIDVNNDGIAEINIDTKANENGQNLTYSAAQSSSKNPSNVYCNKNCAINGKMEPTYNVDSNNDGKLDYNIIYKVGVDWEKVYVSTDPKKILKPNFNRVNTDSMDPTKQEAGNKYDELGSSPDSILINDEGIIGDKKPHINVMKVENDLNSLCNIDINRDKKCENSSDYLCACETGSTDCSTKDTCAKSAVSLSEGAYYYVFSETPNNTSLWLKYFNGVYSFDTNKLKEKN